MSSSVKKYLQYILGATVLAFLVITRSQQITNIIIEYHTVILSVSVFILFVALIVQRKQTSILLENERLYNELQLKQQYIDRDMAMARNIQQGILSEKIPDIRGFKITAACVPAKEIGGDFYGVRRIGSELHFFVGDVSGHGISSALVMSLTNGLIYEVMKQEISPEKIISGVNKSLSTYLNNNINFVTMFYGSINLKTKVLTYVSAGHPPALLQRKALEEPIKLQSGGTILGMFRDNTYVNRTIELRLHDKLFIYTDGFVESRDIFNKELGEGFLVKAILDNIQQSSGKLKDSIYKKLNQTAKTITDDLSLMIIEL